MKTDAGLHLFAAFAVVALIFGGCVLLAGLLLPNPLPRF